MIDHKYYEIVRQKLKLGPFFAPNHKIVFEIIKILWNEEEIKILSHFNSANRSISLRKLSKKLGIPKNEIEKKLARSVKIGTISKMGNTYALVPLAPGVVEKYFTNHSDLIENQIKVGKLYRKYLNEIYSLQLVESNPKIFRPLLPYGAKEKLIKNNESVDVPKLQILPYELVEILINKHDIFAIQTCECRLIGELSGDPCKVASREIGCLNGGAAAQRLINSGIGRQITKEEAIEYVKKVEKMGLVHATVADNSLASSMFICNCCSCHCVFLKPTKKYRIKTITPSNFIPKRDRERCIKCETCIKKCQMGAIFHQLPNESDLTDDYIFTKEEYCIGCGVCASNCPENAIKMVKIRDDDFSKKVQFEGKFLAELFL